MAINPDHPLTPSWLDEFPARIAALDDSHLRRRRRVVLPERGARLQVDGQSMLAFCSNDYLGLANHPALIDAACAGAQRFGVGAASSPLVSGHSTTNEALEQALAAFVGLPRALFFMPVTPPTSASFPRWWARAMRFFLTHSTMPA